MIDRIEINNFATIEHLSFDLGAGFNVITGETGAGKSVLITAVSTVLGDRADTTPRENDCFETNVDWLDTIAFGNNYLDGNYRRDAVGNNKVNPITNTLDMI